MTVLRVFRLVNSFGMRRLRVLFSTIIRVLPRVRSLIIVMMLIIFVYAVFCVQHFAFVDLEQGDELGSYVNF